MRQDRTVQTSEVMRSVGRSHIQRCVRAAAAQAMYDPCYYGPGASGAPRPVSAPAAGRGAAAGGRPTRTSQGNALTDAAHHSRGAATNEQSLTEALTVRRC